MALSNKQKAALHTVPAALGIDEAQRRIIQRNVGGFHSSADPTASHEGFAAVMAFYEGRAGGHLRGYSRGYWAGQHAANEAAVPGGPTHRLLDRVDREAERLGWDRERVDGFLAGPHCSGGAAIDVEHASPYWLGKLIDALRAMADRNERASHEDPEAPRQRGTS